MMKNDDLDTTHIRDGQLGKDDGKQKLQLSMPKKEKEAEDSCRLTEECLKLDAIGTKYVVKNSSDKVKL